MIGSGGILTGYEGEKPRELDWSSLVGTCGLIYYICMYMFVPDLLMSVLEYSSIQWHGVVAFIKHSHGMEEKRDMMQPYGGGRMEEKNIAMHCTEMNKVRGA